MYAVQFLPLLGSWWWLVQVPRQVGVLNQLSFSVSPKAENAHICPANGVGHARRSKRPPHRQRKRRRQKMHSMLWIRRRISTSVRIACLAIERVSMSLTMPQRRGCLVKSTCYLSREQDCGNWTSHRWALYSRASMPEMKVRLMFIWRQCHPP